MERKRQSNDHALQRDSFVLCDVKAAGFPITYASPGFEGLTGYGADECLGHTCGRLIGGASIRRCEATLSSVARAVDILPEELSEALDTITAHVADECGVMAASPHGQKTGFALAVNRRKGGEVFVCELVMHVLKHPALGMVYAVGLQRDISDLVSVSHLLSAVRQGRYGELVSMHGAQVKTRVRAIQRCHQSAHKFWEHVLTDIRRTPHAFSEEPQSAATASSVHSDAAASTTAMASSSGSSAGSISHGSQEAAEPPPPPASRATSRASQYKTSLCKWFKLDRCQNGSSCHFAHGVHELRTGPPKALPPSPPAFGGLGASGTMEHGGEQPANVKPYAERLEDARAMSMPEFLTKEGSFILCDAKCAGFPIRYTSAGFTDLFGYSAQECLGSKCGALVGGPSIARCRATVAATARALHLPPRKVKEAIAVLSGYASDKSESMMAHPGQWTDVYLALNRKKSGAIFVCEIDMSVFRHPTSGLHYAVGLQRDMTGEISVERLVTAALLGTHPALVKSRQELTATELSAWLRGGAAVEYFNAMATETWLGSSSPADIHAPISVRGHSTFALEGQQGAAKPASNIPAISEESPLLVEDLAGQVPPPPRRGALPAASRGGPRARVQQHGSGGRKQAHKTTFCIYHLQGVCRYNKNCRFAHSCRELAQQGEPTKKDLYKTDLCKWFKMGCCWNGSSCSFAHGIEDVNTADASTMASEPETRGADGAEDMDHCKLDAVLRKSAPAQTQGFHRDLGESPPMVQPAQVPPQHVQRDLMKLDRHIGQLSEQIVHLLQQMKQGPHQGTDAATAGHPVPAPELTAG